jgi:hypothetical protein
MNFIFNLVGFTFDVTHSYQHDGSCEQHQAIEDIHGHDVVIILGDSIM